MLERPNLQDETLIACVREHYGVQAVHVAFLPLGADLNTAVFRVVADDGTAYFMKLRSGVFDETSVTLPRHLSDRGIAAIIPPLPTRTGRLWAHLMAYTVILYPFVQGRNGYELDFTAQLWREFGAALKRIHTTSAPPTLMRAIQRERYSPQWRELVRAYLARVERESFDDPVAAKVALLLTAERQPILDLVDRAEHLARRLQSRPQHHVLCHSDVHAGNLLIDAAGALFIVDWDNPILAPKERDLMFIGGGQGFTGHTAGEEETFFYQGYGQTQIDPVALAYYRYERIVQDIAAYCDQLLGSDQGGEDREQSLRYLASNFLPGGTIEVAYRSDQSEQSQSHPQGE